MKVVNSYSGQEVHTGDMFHIPGVGDCKLLKVRCGPFSGRFLYEIPKGTRIWGPLVIRYTHPSYMLQRVGFIPS
jgi:hypothetical protein